MKIRRAAGIIIFACCFLFVFWNRQFLNRLPIPFSYSFSSPTNVFEGESGKLYVIDNGKKEIAVVDADRKYERTIYGGKKEKGFFYASRICEEEKGGIYVADVVYSGKGTRIGKERILYYDPEGRYKGTLYEQTYEEGHNPYQYGNLLEIKQQEGKLSVLFKETSGLLHFYLDADTGEIRDEEFFEVPKIIYDATYDTSSGSIYFTTKMGECYKLSGNSAGKKAPEELIAAGTEVVPFSIASGRGRVFFTDLVEGSVMEWTEDGIKSILDPLALQTVNVSESGRVAATDYAGIYEWDNGVLHSYTALPPAKPGLRVLSWVALGLLLLFLAGMLLLGVLRLFKKIQGSQQAMLILFVLIGCVAVAFTVGGLILKELVSQQRSFVMNDMSMVADIMVDQIDTAHFSELKDLGDYRNEAYYKVREPLDRIIDNSFAEGNYYYYILYRMEEEQLIGMLDFEDTVCLGQPIYEYGDNEYTNVITKGQEGSIYGEVSAYGSWSLVLKPVYNEAGEAVAALEVGMNLDELEQQKKELILELIITVLVSVVVILMFLLEVIFLISNRTGRRGTDHRDAGAMEPALLRILIFFIYLSDSLQDAFIVQLCNRLCSERGISSGGVVAALPISLELFMAAFFALIGGRIAEKAGTRKNLQGGLLIMSVGFLLCGGLGNFYALLAGKVLIGAGMGIVSVTANAMAAMGRDEEECSRSFAGINAGVLSGITVGDGLGSLLLVFGTYRLVYTAGACIVLTGVLIARMTKDMRPVREEKEGKKITTLQFLRNRKVWSFFLFLLVPFMLMIYYREYFFPLYAQEAGITEVTIGRLFLICGLLIIYAGPFLGQWLIGRIGAYASMIVSSGLMFGNVLLFMIYPNIITAVIGVFIVSLNVSFAYTCQNSYFASLSVCREYGEGNSMGIYSMMDNIGQTLGPILFGGLLTLGYVTGVRIIGTAFGILLLAYLLIQGSGSLWGSYRRKKGTDKE